jgi:hypothetical protein
MSLFRFNLFSLTKGMPCLLESSAGGALKTRLHSSDISGAVPRLVQAGLPCRLT